MTTIGEESFVDTDSNGQFNGDDMAIAIGEPYRDDNENLMYDLGEVFSDFDNNGVRDDETQPGYIGFNGLLCDPAATEGCNAINDTLFVSDQTIVLMSSSGATITDDVGGNLDATSGFGTANVFVGDSKGNGSAVQPMPAGTIVKATTSNGSLAGPSTFTVPCTSSPGFSVFPFSIEADDDSSTGVLTIEVESPRGLVSVYIITVDD